jgi:MFS family permease
MLRLVPDRLRTRQPEALDVLRVPAFRRLFLSGTFEDVAYNVRAATISWLMLELTGSALWVGLAMGVRVIPGLAFGPLGGVAADLLSRRNLLLAGEVALAAISATAAVLALTTGLQPWQLLAISAAGASVGAFLSPAAWAMIADLVPAHRLTSANGLIGTSASSGEMIGPAIAGFVIAALSGGAAFVLSAAAFASAAALLLRLPAEPARRTHATVRSVLADLKAGARYVVRTKPLPWLIPLLGVTNILGVAIFPLVPVYARDVLDAGPTGFGLLAGAIGVGFLCGSVLIATLGNYRRRGVVIIVTNVVWDACMVGFSFSTWLPLSMALLFVLGLAGIYWFNAMVTLWQSSATPDMRGRVMSVFAMADALFPLGWVYGGALAEVVGIQAAIWISAAGGTPVVLLLFALSPALRKT